MNIIITNTDIPLVGVIDPNLPKNGEVAQWRAKGFDPENCLPGMLSTAIIRRYYPEGSRTPSQWLALYPEIAKQERARLMGGEGDGLLANALGKQGAEQFWAHVGALEPASNIVCNFLNLLALSGNLDDPLQFQTEMEIINRLDCAPVFYKRFLDLHGNLRTPDERRVASYLLLNRIALERAMDTTKDMREPQNTEEFKFFLSVQKHIKDTLIANTEAQAQCYSRELERDIGKKIAQRMAEIEMPKLPLR